jgi:hypothetical protein
MMAVSSETFTNAYVVKISGGSSAKKNSATKNKVKRLDSHISLQTPNH